MTDEQPTPDTEDTSNAPEADESTEESNDDTDQFDAERARDKIRKANAEARNLRERLAQAEKQKQDTESAGSERVTALEANLLRLRVALKHGLPESIAKRLSGTTEEELLADAEELMDLFGSKKPPTQQPKERLRGGGDPTQPADVDIDEMVKRVFNN